ncbi:ComF family protein [Ramlibacter sp. MAHUQ-53]|uniref:ComF family protein n=1 Tax=unclassified Ramlibacter TaxID=2617605 RepID=UPI0036309AD6
MFRAWIQGLAQAVPARCEVCRSWPAQPVCGACALRFAAPVPRCGRCALPVAAGVAACGACLGAPAALDGCVAALPYAYPWDGLVARFKFRGEPGWAAAFAAMLREAPGARALLRAADRLLPMPLAPARLAERGYNQALELARRLAPPGRLDARSLLRVRETPPQATLDREARRRNMARAFAVEPGRAASLAGRHLLLVDDVMTSGASLAAAAAALRQAGAGRVSALVLARTDDL